MEIRYLGHASFLLKGKDTTVVCDPFDKNIGISFPNVSADIVTISHQHSDHNASREVKGEPLVIELPGEYEKKNVRVTGISVYHDTNEGADRGKNILFKIEIDDISILHCGDLGHELTDEIVDEIGEVHVLLIPVGGFYTIGSDEAVKVIKKLEPSVVIPMHYNDPRLNQELFSKLATVEDFTAKMGMTMGEKVKKLSLKREEMEGEMKLIVMDYD